MSFLYMFELTDFDAKGQVSETRTFDLNHSRANYLYLISKYNQTYLQNAKMNIPEFFKEDLPNVLTDVENGGDFSKAKKTVVSNCLPNVQNIAKSSENDKDFVAKLNTNVSVKDKMFADSVKKINNEKHLEYVITLVSGKVFEDLIRQIETPDNLLDKKAKSGIYKDVIKYNSLVATADKVKEHNFSVEDAQKMVG